MPLTAVEPPPAGLGIHYDPRPVGATTRTLFGATVGSIIPRSGSGVKNRKAIGNRSHGIGQRSVRDELFSKHSLR
jgi:hypothetical protein